MTDPQPTAQQFWETHYQKGARPWTGRPNAVLRQFAESLSAGTALDLGCSEGNTAVWLARRGWQVTGVDVSATAVERATAHAADAGVSDLTTFERRDLNQSFPEGRFGLVYALYLESPVALQRGQILRAAAAAVFPGGLLVVVQHGSAAPWSWNQDAKFPEPEAVLESIGLDLSEWHINFLGSPERELTGPGNMTATVKDIVLALRKK
ncbi:class I SAM-dependent methyltransferase [Deinococcus altitudinis]|uniref:class I SAM-dependent methyltransferase n=1 Tax=Deinococcus altitudinis TaxID=468914 RepID=UPI0038923C46